MLQERGETIIVTTTPTRTTRTITHPPPPNLQDTTHGTTGIRSTTTIDLVTAASRVTQGTELLTITDLRMPRMSVKNVTTLVNDTSPIAAHGRDHRDNLEINHEECNNNNIKSQTDSRLL